MFRFWATSRVFRPETQSDAFWRLWAAFYRPQLRRKCVGVYGFMECICRRICGFWFDAGDSGCGASMWERFFATI